MPADRSAGLAFVKDRLERAFDPAALGFILVNVAGLDFRLVKSRFVQRGFVPVIM
jgi:hypothetical protein